MSEEDHYQAALLAEYELCVSEASRLYRKADRSERQAQKKEKRAREIADLMVSMHLHNYTDKHPNAGEEEETEETSPEETSENDAPRVGSADHPLEPGTSKQPKSELHKKILELDAEGMAAKDIAEKVGLTASAIYYVLKQYKPKEEPGELQET